jgi:hypothetical protein
MKKITVKSLVNIHLMSLTGHSMRIPANMPTEIPEVCAKEAFARGCALVEAAAPAPVVTTPVVTPPVVTTPGTDEAQIKVAIHKLVEANDPDSFKKDGSPKVAAVAAAMGIPVTAEEVTSAWEAIQAE